MMEIPQGWKVEEHDGYKTLIGPEGDIQVHLLQVNKAEEEKPEDLARESWRRVKSDFTLPVSGCSTLAVDEGWSCGWSVEFKVPAGVLRQVTAVGKELSTGTVYLSLIDTTTAGLALRGSQISIITSKWRPSDMLDASLADTPAKEWTDADITELSDFIRSTMKTLQVPGASVGVIDKEGKVIFKEHFGVKDLDTKEPADDNTLYRLGSSTKSMTTALMAVLVQRGLMSWDDPIKKHLPEFQLADPTWTETMTMRQSMSAATGMPRRDAELLYKYRGSAEDRLAELRMNAPTSKFGEVFQYSNPLVTAGGYAAGRAYCKDGSVMEAYERATRDLLFNPLGMSTIEWELDRVIKLSHGTPHGPDHHGNWVSFPVEVDDFPYSVAPAGGAWSTLNDIMKFVQFELNEGSVGGEQLASREVYLQRHKPMVAISETSSYGLGLIMETVSGVPVAGHGGNSLGFSSDFFFLPKHGLGMAILTNASQAVGFIQALRNKFVEVTFSMAGKSSAIVESTDQMLKGLIASLKDRVQASSDEVASVLDGLLENEYYNEDIGKMTFYRQEGKYFMKIGDFVSVIVVEKGEKPMIVPVGPHILLAAAMLGYKYIIEQDGSITHETGQVTYPFKLIKTE